MGPHSFKCGSAAENRRPSARPPRLQWGRTLSSAEVQAERQRMRPQQSKLQWGRTLSSAEVRPSASADAIFFRASMGPHSFKCGSILITGGRSQDGLASMGPHSFKCGSRPRWRLRRSGSSRFNGAALFQVRKSRQRN